MTERVVIDTDPGDTLTAGVEVAMEVDVARVRRAIRERALAPITR